MNLSQWLRTVLVAPLVSAPSLDGQTVRDSAGVRIITFVEQPAGKIVLSPSPSVEIGVGTDQTTELHRIGDIRVLRDGTIVVANGGSTELKFFTHDGRYLRSAGRKGTGPGEFQSLGGMWVTAQDSLVVADGRLRRFVVFGPDGTHARTTTIDTPSGRRTPRLLDYLTPDLLLGGSSDVSVLPARQEPYYFTQLVYALDLSGHIRSTLGSFGEGEHFVQAHPERASSYWNRAFGRQMTIRSVGDFVATGDGQAFEVRLHTSRGALVRVLRSRQVPPRVTAADIEAFKSRALAGAATPQMKAMMERMVAEMPFPARMPTYERFESDGDGVLWIKRYPRPSDSTEVWSALTTAGAYYGPVELPPRVRLRSITREAIFCVWRDADDVEHVRKYSYKLVASR